MEQDQLHLRTHLPSHGHVGSQQSEPRVVVSSAANFERVSDPGEMRYYIERPMMLNAWTQTTGEDFVYLQENNLKQNQQTETEMELLEKIRILEENLRAHSDILSQIHATSARKNTLLLQQQQQQQQHQHYQLQMQSQPPPSRQPQFQQQQQQHQPEMQLPPHAGSALTAAASVPLSAKASSQSLTAVINPVQQVPTESVKYTIIAEANGDTSGEPIEIQLAEEDNALNLNSSADSGRLEICLAEENVEVKTERPQHSPPPTQHNTTTTASAFGKRRKFSKEHITPESVQSTNANYYFNELGFLTPLSALPTTTAATVPPRGQQRRVELSTPQSRNAIQTHTSTPNTINQKMVIDNVMVSIGPNNTRVPAMVYENMSWTSASIATRKLLMAIFDRKTLATHSMTGKPSPAFKDHDKPLKEMLDPLIIQDIIFVVTRKCNVSEKEVRNAITTKCADENKMMKLQLNKKRPLRELNKENEA